MDKIINAVCDYIAIYQVQGEEATRKAYENACKRLATCKKHLALMDNAESTHAKEDLKFALTDDENTIISLALEALYARGNTRFLNAMFAEKDFLKLYDYRYHQRFLPKNRWEMGDRQSRKWNKVEAAEDALIGAWVYYNLPCLNDILNKVLESMTKSRDYMEEAETTRENFLYEVGSGLGWDYAPSFETSVLNTLVEMFDDIDIERFGYEREGIEAMAWHEFCNDRMGLPYYLENVHCEFVTDVAKDMLYEYV